MTYISMVVPLIVTILLAIPVVICIILCCCVCYLVCICGIIMGLFPICITPCAGIISYKGIQKVLPPIIKIITCGKYDLEESEDNSSDIELSMYESAGENEVEVEVKDEEVYESVTYESSDERKSSTEET